MPFNKAFPLVVAVGGDWGDHYKETCASEERMGHIVLATFSPSCKFGEQIEWPEELERRRIDICDEFIVVNPYNTISDVTKRSVEYAFQTNKRVRYTWKDYLNEKG